MPSWPTQPATRDHVIGYGLNGLPYPTENLCYKFPLQTALSLSEVPNSQQTVTRPKPQNKHKGDSKNSPSFPDLLISSELYAEAVLWTLPYVYDPAPGHIFVSSLLKQRFSSASACIRILVYASGSTLNVSLLKPHKQRLVGENVIGGRPHTGSMWLALPRLGSHLGVDLRNNIFLISFPAQEAPGMQSRSMFCVRTEYEIYLLELFSGGQKTPDISCTLLSQTRSDIRLADVAQNPLDHAKYVTIDIQGEWHIWTMLELLISGKLETSPGWHKVVWVDSETFLVFERDCLYVVTIGKEPEKVTQKSDFRDVYQLCDSPNEIVVLTTEQLIWARLSKTGLVPIVAWSHILEPEDVSLTLSVCSIAQSKIFDLKNARVFDDGLHNSREFVAVVYSRLHSMKYLIRMSCENGLYTLSEPLITTLGEPGIVRDMCILRAKYVPNHMVSRPGDLNSDDEESPSTDNPVSIDEDGSDAIYDTCEHEYYVLYQMSIDGSISRRVLSSDFSAVFQPSKSTIAEDDFPEEADDRTKLTFDTLMKSRHLKELRRLFKRIDPANENVEAKNIDAFLRRYLLKDGEGEALREYILSILEKMGGGSERDEEIADEFLKSLSDYEENDIDFIVNLEKEDLDERNREVLEGWDALFEENEDEDTIARAAMSQPTYLESQEELFSTFSQAFVSQPAAAPQEKKKKRKKRRVGFA